MTDSSNKSALRGKVETFLKRKGYGFIRGEDGARYFVHFKDIKSAGFKTLVEGEEVEFNLYNGAKGPQAGNVLRLNPPPEEQEPLEPPARKW